MLNMVSVYESIRELLDEIEEEYYSIEDEENEEIREDRTENLDELKTALDVVISEMDAYELREEEIQEDREESER